LCSASSSERFGRKRSDHSVLPPSPPLLLELELALLERLVLL
jgi:hypothetical protein